MSKKKPEMIEEIEKCCDPKKDKKHKKGRKSKKCCEPFALFSVKFKVGGSSVRISVNLMQVALAAGIFMLVRKLRKKPVLCKPCLGKLCLRRNKD
ncbi:MAG: hypothetical protein IKO27_09255 [Ruminococcus sp.]|nr:hypothetical protein [Ruminococcus sp.]